MRAWLLRLYPEGRRRRYEEELAVFLEQLPVTPALCWDVLKGAWSLSEERCLSPCRCWAGRRYTRR